MNEDERLIDRVDKLEAFSLEFLSLITKASLQCDRVIAKAKKSEYIPAPGCWGMAVGLGGAKWQDLKLPKPAVAIGYKGPFVVVVGQSLEWQDSGMSTGWRSLRAVMLNLPETSQEADQEFKAWELGLGEVRCREMLVAPSCAWLLHKTVELAARESGK